MDAAAVNLFYFPCRRLISLLVATAPGVVLRGAFKKGRQSRRFYLFCLCLAVCASFSRGALFFVFLISV